MTYYIIFLVLLSAFFASGPPQAAAQLGPGRRYTTIERLKVERLSAVHADRLRFAAQRHSVSLRTGYTDYRAVLHAHAEDSEHTGGTRLELLAAAKSTGVNIVMLSDHVGEGRDFISDNWRGLRDGVLFIPGAESEGFLAYPVASIKDEKWKSRDEFIRIVKRGGGNIFLSHVEEKLDWPTASLDGLEIYNHHTDVKDETEFYSWLRSAFADPDRLGLLQRVLSEYPQEVFGAQQDYLAAIIGKWDRDTLDHRLTGIAANDCHHNQVFTVTAVDQNTIEVGYIGSRPTTARVTAASQAPGVSALTAGRKPGELIARLDFDPYERSLRYVTTHILAKRLDEQAVRDALRQGHAYVAHDWLCDPTGFAFVVMNENSAGRADGIMGDEAKFASGLRIRAELPVAGILKLFCNGSVVRSLVGDRLEFQPGGPGVYRLEAWLRIDGEERPWIYSNPVYIR
ncbi:MAG TPA: histidinol phosphatase [Blastocatellia bacterium]|nr:histidinol phosphatase [Blastocatellia bacterium]